MSFIIFISLPRYISIQNFAKSFAFKVLHNRQCFRVENNASEVSVLAPTIPSEVSMVPSYPKGRCWDRFTMTTETKKMYIVLVTPPPVPPHKKRVKMLTKKLCNYDFEETFCWNCSASKYFGQ